MPPMLSQNLHRFQVKTMIYFGVGIPLVNTYGSLCFPTWTRYKEKLCYLNL